MIFLKRCKSKRVIAIVLGLILSFVNMLPAHGQVKEMNNYNKIKVVDNNMNKKSIGIKRQVASNSEIITINGTSYKARRMNMKCTAYCNDPITSTGVKPRPMHTVAIDPSLIKYGTKIYIPYFDTIFTCEDCGGKIKGNRLDIYMHTYNECMQFGIQNLQVYIIE